MSERGADRVRNRDRHHPAIATEFSLDLRQQRLLAAKAINTARHVNQQARRRNHVLQTDNRTVTLRPFRQRDERVTISVGILLHAHQRRQRRDRLGDHHARANAITARAVAAGDHLAPLAGDDAREGEWLSP